MNEEIQKLLIGLGSLAEANKICFDAHLKAGFNEMQAMRFTEIFFMVTYTNSLREAASEE